MNLLIERALWYRYYTKSKLRSLMRKIGYKSVQPQYKTAVTYEGEDIQEVIKNKIIQGTPMMVARFGSNEANITADVKGVSIHAKRNVRKAFLDSIHRNAGLFPYGQKTALEFGRLMEDSAKEVDVLGCWDTFMQDYLVDHLCDKNVKLTKLRNLEPYYHTNPWSSALEGKRVVVIHPFSQTIESQYQKREKLFENQDVLPAFSLRTVKAVQTIAFEHDERFSTWFEALDYMYDQTFAEDFDVALIGCGAYGFPLAAKIKQSGKSAIHLGGSTQILFGIKGKRWDEHPVISKLYNEHWVRPSDCDTPKRAGEIEGSCYW